MCTYNTSLKNRLSEYAAKYPAECRLVDDDENGCLTFEIRKGRFSFKLNAPEGSQRAGKEEYQELAARQEVMTRRPWGGYLMGGFCFFSANCRSGLALFRLNEYNIFGLVYASIVIMRCRK